MFVGSKKREKAAARKSFAHTAGEISQGNSKHSLERQLLEEQPLEILRAQARKKYISGRSSMSKVELIQALQRS